MAKNIIKPQTEDTSTNRPRNHVVRDATTDYHFTYIQYGKPTSIIVHQTPAEETWPGGALWDIGVLLSHVMVGLAGGKTNKVLLPSRLLQAFPTIKDLLVLELGCGVGLTGIVAAAVLGTKLTILTDLDVVITNVTQRNVIANSSPATGKVPYRWTNAGKRGRIMAMPLCWGNEDDERAVAEAFEFFTKSTKSPRKGKDESLQPKDPTKPDLILIGDVAYQHKPGAPSHFDALVSTLLKFIDFNTTVIFGTRMRMPASSDLLQLFLQHMDEVITPVSADEIDPSFGKFKHQITVHVFRKKALAC